MHKASWCFCMFLKWKCKVTFMLCAQMVRLTMCFHIEWDHNRSCILPSRYRDFQIFSLPWTNGVTVDVRTTRWDIVDFVSMPPTLAEPSMTNVFCIPHWPLLHSSNQFHPNLICMPSFSPSLDAFAHVTKPHLILLLFCDCSYLTLILNWRLPNQKSLFYPVRTSLLRLHFISSLFPEILLKWFCSRFHVA